MAGETKSLIDCGEWRLDREIGRGAYGIVYLAEGADGAWAAVKVCRRADIGDEHYSRELRGAKLYSAISPQEGLLCMHELAETPWGFYVVMDLADDEFDRESPIVESYRPKTLASVIVGEKALPLGECVKLGISLAKGLVALQRHHLLHRDIKPGNVIYVEGRPALSDPGLVVEESEAASLVGTPGYVPPENFTAAPGDVYSLGLTLKAASFGRSIEDIDKGPAIVADTGARFFPAWWRILNKATDPTPSRRYQSAKALLSDLENLSRKISLSPIIESRVAQFAFALSVLAFIAVVVTFYISGKRMKEDLASRSAENRSLVKDLNRRASENKLLTDNIVRQTAEIKSLKEDLSKQTAEIKPLRKDLVRQSEENKALKADIDRQSAEINSLKEDLGRQPAESAALKRALERQSEENTALKANLYRQSAEINSLKEDLGRQPAESAALKRALERQSEENTSLKADLAKQAEEIKLLKEDLVSRPIGTNTQNATLQSVEIERLRKEVEQLRKVKGVSLEQAKMAAQDVWEAVLRNAYRETFDGISEEELSSRVKKAREEIFGDKK